MNSPTATVADTSRRRRFDWGSENARVRLSGRSRLRPRTHHPLHEARQRHRFSRVDRQDLFVSDRVRASESGPVEPDAISVVGRVVSVHRSHEQAILGLAEPCRHPGPDRQLKRDEVWEILVIDNLVLLALEIKKTRM